MVLRTRLSLIVLLLLVFSPVSAATVLQGRIEQIKDNPDIKLPAELRATALRLQQFPVQPNILRAELKSFPAILRGNWKGQLKLTDVDYSDSFIAAQPADAARDQEVVYTGGTAEASFRFYNPRAGVLTMAPPELKVARIEKSGRVSAYVYIAVNDLDSERYVSLSGTNKIRNTLLKNDVRMLAPNVVEQDMIVAVALIEKTTGKQTLTFEETVYRFSKTKPFELSVEVADIRYGEDGSMWSKALLEGDVR